MRCVLAEVTAVVVAFSAASAHAEGLRPPHLLLDDEAAAPTFLEQLAPDEQIEPPAEADAAALEVARDAIALVIAAAAATGDAYAPLLPDFASRQTQLRWPVARNAAISAPFGLRARSHSNTRDRNSGLAFSAAEPTPMVAVAPGIVRFASIIEGMGGTVVVDHGGGYHTVYARLLRIDVVPFEAVAEGAIVGEAGAAVFEELPEAYFELRVDGIPVDPTLWLTPGR